MATATLQANPTEYKVVRYRSKSEAMFARYLDLQSQLVVSESDNLIVNAGYIYEPEGYEIDGYQIDFMQWYLHEPSAYISNGVVSRPALSFPSYSLIEYKPKLPSKTYIQNAAKRWNRLKAVLNESGWGCSLPYMSFEIYFGSVYVKESECGVVNFELDKPYSYQDSWLEGYSDDLQSYRFDLEHSRES